MKEGEVESKQKIIPYEISQTQFEMDPKAPQPYQLGDRVTRANFCNFLVQSFRISMGKTDVQILFMRWLKLRNGFDYSTTLANLMAVGGWDRLSNAEKKEIKNQFSKAKVPEHPVILKEPELEDFMRSQIEELELRAREISTSEGEMKAPSLENINTFAEFSVIARQEAERLRNKAVVSHNIEMMEKDMQELLGEESVGGNAGTIVIGGKKYPCAGLNGYANKETGKILAFGNFQNISEDIINKGIHFTLKEAINLDFGNMLEFTKIVDFIGANEFSEKGRKNIEAAIEYYNAKHWTRI